MTRFHFLFNFILSFCFLARSPSLVALGHYVFVFVFVFLDLVAFIGCTGSLLVFVFLDLVAFIGCTGSSLAFLFSFCFCFS